MVSKGVCLLIHSTARSRSAVKSCTRFAALFAISTLPANAITLLILMLRTAHGADSGGQLLTKCQEGLAVAVRQRAAAGAAATKERALMCCCSGTMQQSKSSESVLLKGGVRQDGCAGWLCCGTGRVAAMLTSAERQGDGSCRVRTKGMSMRRCARVELCIFIKRVELPQIL